MLPELRLLLRASAGLSVLACAAPAAPATPPPSAAENFEKHCVDCHGTDGRAQTRLGRKARARDLTDRKAMAKLTDDDVFKTIKFGRKTSRGEEKMDAFGDGLSDAEITALVAYVRTFAK